MATVPNVTSGLGLRKFQSDGFLLTRVYMTCNEGWCTLLYYVRLMSPWMRPCKHGYYVSSRATIKFSGRTLPHGVCWENCTFLIFTFVYSMDGHTVLQELILSYLLVYLLATYCTSHITCCHSTHPLLLYPPPFFLRSNRQYNLIHWTSNHRRPGTQHERCSTVSSASTYWEQNVPTE